jgi:hypothetical protein
VASESEKEGARESAREGAREREYKECALVESESEIEGATERE